MQPTVVHWIHVDVILHYAPAERRTQMSILTSHHRQAIDTSSTKHDKAGKHVCEQLQSIRFNQGTGLRLSSHLTVLLGGRNALCPAMPYRLARRAVNRYRDSRRYARKARPTIHSERIWMLELKIVSTLPHSSITRLQRALRQWGVSPRLES